MKKEILIATHNTHKKEEIQQILGENFNVTSLTDYDIHDEIVEDGETFHANALIKAHKNIDAIIKLIRNSKGGKEDAKQALITKFDFADREAKFIVEQELYKISNMQIKTLETEIEALNERLKEHFDNDMSVISIIMPKEDK